MVGLGMGMVYNSSFSILPIYFDKYKATAAGISMCGLGVGAFVFPAIIKALLDTYGWRGTFVMIGGIYAHGAVLGSLFVQIKPQQKKSRDSINHAIKDKETTSEEQHFNVSLKENQDNPHDRIHQKQENGTYSRIAIVDKKISQNNKCRKNILLETLLLLKNISFMCICLSYLVSHFALMIVYTHFGNHILSLGFSEKDVVFLYVLMGISKTIMLALAGLLSEIAKFNVLLVFSACYILIGTITMIFPLFHSLPFFYAYSVLFCIFISPPDVFCVLITVDSLPFEKVAAGLGLASFSCFPGVLIGPPLAGRNLLLFLHLGN